MSSGAIMTIGSDLAPVKTRGEFLGSLATSLAIQAGMVAPLVVGLIAQQLALQSAAVAMAGAGLMAAGIFAFLVPETLDQSTAQARGHRGYRELTWWT